MRVVTLGQLQGLGATSGQASSILAQQMATYDELNMLSEDVRHSRDAERSRRRLEIALVILSGAGAVLSTILFARGYDKAGNAMLVGTTIAGTAMSAARLYGEGQE